ncbi:MAG: methyl-accepting chemotaxis protein [Chitinivibrionales bacterium]|nr:methyl-accepting chemotaxis protein [Chitinivibrionales bacterium]
MKRLVDEKNSQQNLGKEDSLRHRFSLWYEGAQRKRIENKIPLLRQPLSKLASYHNRLNTTMLTNLSQGSDSLSAEQGFADERAAIHTAYDEAMTIADVFHAKALETFRAKTHFTLLLSIGFVILNILVCVMARAILKRSLSASIVRCQSLLGKILEGKLAVSDFRHTKDEVGELTRNLETMSSSLRKMVQNLVNENSTLEISSGVLFNVSKKMADTATDTAKISADVDASIEQMRNEITTVSENTRTASENLESIVAGTQLINTAIEGIARNTQKTQMITAQTATRARFIQNQMVKLKGMAEKINIVIDSVNTIAETSNLLSINATIEAVNAGQAGQGFVVVSKEFKELSRKTRMASDGARQELGTLQQTITKECDEIISVISSISVMYENVVDIAAAVVDQVNETATINSKVTAVSSALKCIIQEVDKMQSEIGRIWNSISYVKCSTEEVAAISSNINLCAKELDTLTKNIADLTGKYEV